MKKARRIIFSHGSPLFLPAFLLLLILFSIGCAHDGGPLTKVTPESPSTPKLLVIRPKISDEVLVNPGMGFMTFQRFEGDSLDKAENPSEGFPIAENRHQRPRGGADFPATRMAYYRLYWRFVEPQPGEYHWELIDKALQTAKSRGQLLMIRIPPHGPDKASDVPDWYRTAAHEPFDPQRKFPSSKWLVDPENPAYLKYYGGMIREFAKRYDGHPDLEAVDVSLLGAWGEGEMTEAVSTQTRESLLDCYYDHFKKTPLLAQITDELTIRRAREKGISLGWRVDCLGDLGAFSPTWSHMYDYYPQQVVKLGLQKAWEQAPVSMEVCGTLKGWKKRGWDLRYIINQSLKWHISSFNAKSSEVPKQYGPEIRRWLKSMGYRISLRKFVFPEEVEAGKLFSFTSWWENVGIAPSYRNYPVALRFQREGRDHVFVTDSDIRNWLPGDHLLNRELMVPGDLSEGWYRISVGLVDPVSHLPKVQLAIQGRDSEGWYPLGKIRVVSKEKERN